MDWYHVVTDKRTWKQNPVLPFEVPDFHQFDDLAGHLTLCEMRVSGVGLHTAESATQGVVRVQRVADGWSRCLGRPRLSAAVADDGLYSTVGRATPTLRHLVSTPQLFSFLVLYQGGQSPQRDSSGAKSEITR